MMNQRLLVTAISVALVSSASLVSAEQRSDSMQQPQGMTTAVNSGLATMTVGDLDGKDIKNSAGDEVGEIKSVARGPDNQAYAIVAVGGFWGIGARDVAIPLVDLQLQGDTVILASAKSEDQLKQEAASRDVTTYQTLDDKQSLAEYVGGGATGTTQMSFQRLDADGDGYINTQEAATSPGLAAQIPNADRNGDGRLDQSEFSAFETQSE